jgi:hypothetical protein
MKSSEKKSPITIGKAKLVWSVRHWQRWCSDNNGFLGLSLLVEAAGEKKTRSLIIEFPFEWKGTSLNQERKFKISESELVSHIEHAIQLGWNPESRGKPFVLCLENKA